MNQYTKQISELSTAVSKLSRSNKLINFSADLGALYSIPVKKCIDCCVVDDNTVLLIADGFSVPITLLASVSEKDGCTVHSERVGGAFAYLSDFILPGHFRNDFVARLANYMVRPEDKRVIPAVIPWCSIYKVVNLEVSPLGAGYYLRVGPHNNAQLFEDSTYLEVLTARSGASYEVSVKLTASTHEFKQEPSYSSLHQLYDLFSKQLFDHFQWLTPKIKFEE